MGNKIQKIFVGTNQVRPESPETVLTYDFANDGQQGWSNLSGFVTPSYVVAGFENGEGFYLRAQVAAATEAGFTTMPSGLPSGTLKKIKIWYYLPSSNTGCGINDNGSVSSGYTWEHNDKLGFGSSTPVTIGNYTGELMTEYNITSTGCIGTCAGVPFTFTNSQANNLITAYNNGTLRLYLVTWAEYSNCYLRKVEITIEN